MRLSLKLLVVLSLVALMLTGAGEVRAQGGIGYYPGFGRQPSEEKEKKTTTVMETEEWVTPDWTFTIAPDFSVGGWQDVIKYPAGYRVRQSGANYKLFPVWGGSAAINYKGKFALSGSYEKGDVGLKDYFSESEGRIVFKDGRLDEGSYSNLQVGLAACLPKNFCTEAGYNRTSLWTNSRSDSLGITTWIGLRSVYSGPYLALGAHQARGITFDERVVWYPRLRRTDTSVFRSSRGFTQQAGVNGSGWGASVALGYEVNRWLNPRLVVGYRQFNTKEVPFFTGSAVTEKAGLSGLVIGFEIPIKTFVGRRASHR